VISSALIGKQTDPLETKNPQITREEVDAEMAAGVATEIEATATATTDKVGKVDVEVVVMEHSVVKETAAIEMDHTMGVIAVVLRTRQSCTRQISPQISMKTI